MAYGKGSRRCGRGVRCLLAALSLAAFGCGDREAGREAGGEATPSPTPAPLLSVAGNRIVDASGAPLVLRGLALADPQQLQWDGHWDAEYFRQARSWGARIVRIPVHPRFFRELGPDAYLALLDQGVNWSKQQEMYVILDWHSIGDLYAGVYETALDAIYPTTLPETLDFWRRVALRYRDDPRVAFYEIFNEPTQHADGRHTSTTWSQWRGVVDQIVAEIRQQNPRAIVIVGGFDWAYDLQPVAADPVRHSGVVYAVHPYPNKRQEPWESYWQADFGAFAGRYPVFATEFGFETAQQAPSGSVAVATVDYGERLLRFLEERGISWTVWCFHTVWTPSLLEDWRYTPKRPAGEFFRSALLQHDQG